MPTKKEDKDAKFAIGDVVMGKWPKTNLFFRGKVIDLNEVEYLIRFEDEDNSELPLKYKDVRNTFERSTRSRSRGRTPTRKSPSRKSPARKSPGRPKVPGKVPAAPKKESNSVKKEESSTNEIEVKTIKESESSSVVTNRLSRSGTRQSARIASITEKANSNSIKVDVRSVAKSIEDSKKLSARVVNFCKRSAKCLWETTKVFPFIVLSLCVPFLFTQMCTKVRCSILDFPDIPKRSQNYFDKKAVYAVLGFTLIQLVLTFVPLGRVIKTASGSKIRCNAFFAVLVTFASIPVMMQMNIDVVSIYSLYFRHILVTFICLGIFTSLVLYVKSFYVRRSDLNPSGKSGYVIPDFVEGREVNPRIRTFDIKFFLYRMAFFTLMLINILMALKEFQAKSKNFSPIVIISCVSQIFYCCDLLWFEEAFLTTYEYQKQGTGLFITCGYLSFPFFFSLLSRYVFNYGHNYPWYCLVGVVVLFFIGYIIMRSSVNQKNAFRTNPSSPALSHLESLPTSAGTRLLVSGWWGIVRHPNYLGDLIVNFSWSLLCGFSHAFPWAIFAINLFYMLSKVYTVEMSCKRKYGLAWSSYTARVKYRLIPKVF